jgi:tetratricopeptide (TPR) repeat protein
VGWKTWSAFALVLGAGVAVFTVLPRFVSERPIEPVEDVEEVPKAPPSAIEALDIAEAPADVPEPAPLLPVDSPVEVAPAGTDVSEDAFAAAMTEGLSALKNEDYAIARGAFERAKSLRPEAPEVASGLSQAGEGLRNRAIEGHRDRGLEHERLESWRAAEAEYDSALALDGSLRFAREGKKKSAALALLQEKLDFQIGHAERLSDARALEEASRLLDEASGVEGEGPKRQDAIAKLEALVASYSRPMELQIVSDTLTDVTLQRIGRLGKFDRRVLEVRPGRYVAVGSRAGFRDVRVEFTVEPGKPLAPIRVLCEETI